MKAALPYGLSLVFLSLAPGTAVGQVRPHPVTVDDLAALRDIDDLQPSPDGSHVAYVMDRQIWVISTTGKTRPHALHRGNSPRWSPDGRWIAFFDAAPQEDRHLPSLDLRGQLWVVDANSGSARQVTRLPGGIRAAAPVLHTGTPTSSASRVFDWSPDSRTITFVARTAADIAAAGDSAKPVFFDSSRVLVLTTSSPPELTSLGMFRGAEGVWPYSLTTSNNQLFTVDVVTGAITQLTSDGAHYFDPAWLPNGRSIVVSVGQGPPFVRDGGFRTPQTTNLYVVDLATRRRTSITSGHGVKRGPIPSPDGRSVAYIAADDYEGFPWLMVVPTGGGVVRNVTHQLDRATEMFAWDPGATSLVVQVPDGVSDRLFRIGLSEARPEPVPGVSNYPKCAAVSRQGALAWAESSPTAKGLLRFLPTRDSVPRTLLDANPEIQEWALGAQEVVRWRTSRGDSAEGVLIKPVGYRPGHRYPLLVDAYPIQSDGFQGDLKMLNQTLAGRGYVVFMAAHRATHTAENYRKSAPYNDVARGAKGGDIALDDVTTGIDLLIREGIVDSARIGIFGHSNGGGAVAYLITRTTRFKAAFIAAPVSPDWALEVNLLNELDYPLPLFGGMPWQAPEVYTSLSAIYHLDAITTPVLLAVGDHDQLSALSAIEMFNGLRRLGRDVTLVRYPQAGHIIPATSAEYRHDFWNRLYTMFDRYLKR